MSFEPKKFDQIYAAMVEETRKRLPGMTDFQVGSVLRTLYESFSYEIALLYEQMHQVYRSAYIDYAEGAQLDMLVAIMGIQRNLPDYAEGEVTFERDPGPEEILILAGTLVTTEDSEKSPKRAYKTIEDKSFPAKETRLSVKVQAVDRGEDQVVDAKTITIIPLPIPGIKSVVNNSATRFTGKLAETDEELRRRAKNALITSGKASLIAIQNTLLGLPGIKEVKLIERFDNQKLYGVVDVFVDGTDLNVETRRQYLQGQIDRVRAAGVYVKLQSATLVPIKGVFLIEANPDMKWADRDRQLLETTVRDSILDYLSDMRMGQTLQFNQLVRQVLSIPNVSNLDQFALAATQKRAEPFTASDRQIVAQESEKFCPSDDLIVTSRPLVIPVQVQIQAAQLTPEQSQKVTDVLRQYFSTCKVGTALQLTEIQSRIQTILPISTEQIQLTVGSHSFLSQVSAQEIIPSWAEQVQLEEPIFLYKAVLNLIGAIQFTPANDAVTQKKQEIKKAIAQAVQAFVDRLKPEEGLNLDDLKTALHKTVANQATVSINPEDFRVRFGEEESKLNSRMIKVGNLEKVVIQHLCITSDVEEIQIQITQLRLCLTYPAAVPEGFNADTMTVTIRQAIVAALAEFSNLEAGKELHISSIEQKIDATLVSLNLNPRFVFKLEELQLTATSSGDERTQVLNLHSPPVHVRSVERIKAVTLADSTPLSLSLPPNS